MVLKSKEQLYNDTTIRYPIKTRECVVAGRRRRKKMTRRKAKKASGWSARSCIRLVTLCGSIASLILLTLVIVAAIEAADFIKKAPAIIEEMVTDFVVNTLIPRIMESVGKVMDSDILEQKLRKVVHEEMKQAVSNANPLNRKY